ncbi:MAG TPA: nucleotide exchange factor GrpE [bacterium]|nr:nucleotide exchange factor GrpE [bacterium]
MTMEHEARREEPAAEAGEARPETSRADATDELDGLSMEDLRTRARQARDEARRNWQQFLHSAADLENYKKQAARDRQDAIERTRRQMLNLVLGVVDNLERAMAFGGAQDGPAKSLLDGLRMTHRQILEQLRAIGVRPIEVAGTLFDPRLHEAVAVVPFEQAQRPAGTIAGEVLKGYFLNDDVLRPAKVAVVGGEADQEHREDGR